jgi:hypothetical protein
MGDTGAAVLAGWSRRPAGWSYRHWLPGFLSRRLPIPTRRALRGAALDAALTARGGYVGRPLPDQAGIPDWRHTRLGLACALWRQ